MKKYIKTVYSDAITAPLAHICGKTRFFFNQVQKTLLWSLIRSSITFAVTKSVFFNSSFKKPGHFFIFFKNSHLRFLRKEEPVVLWHNRRVPIKRVGQCCILFQFLLDPLLPAYQLCMNTTCHFQKVTVNKHIYYKGVKNFLLKMYALMFERLIKLLV